LPFASPICGHSGWGIADRDRVTHIEINKDFIDVGCTVAEQYTLTETRMPGMFGANHSMINRQITRVDPFPDGDFAGGDPEVFLVRN
jgi:hypothetical protein